MQEIITINPFTETICGQYPLMTQHEVEQMIAKVAAAQKTWSRTNLNTRMICLTNTAKLLLKNKETYAKLITTEMGKPITQAISEIEKCAALCHYYAENANQLLAPELITTNYNKSYRSYQPLGIILAIMPWNFPFWQVMRFAIPNLLLGNAGLLKHAPNSTGVALAIEKLFHEAGFLENLFRSLVIDVGLVPFIIHHPAIMGVTLTGSNNAGKAVAKEAGAALKKVVLELGGSDPYIILEDADLELAAKQCVTSRLNNAGQVCIAAKRIIVMENIKKDFVALIIENAKTYHMGDPTDPTMQLGPMARDDLRVKLHEQVQRSIKHGAQCVLGGTLPNHKGYFYPATILLNVTQTSPAFHEELFGPVIGITCVSDEQTALQLANQTEFGLAGAIFTRDIAKGEKLARENIEVGTCAVNTLVASDPRLPFGGIKQSGFGRELSREGIHEFANIKTVIVR